MGDVFLARASGAAGFVRPVVLKEVRRDLLTSEETRAFFEREARIMARLRHQNVVGIQDFQKDEGGYCMVLEYVRGLTLADLLRFHRLRQERLPTYAVAAIVEQVLAGLAHAHGLMDGDGRATPVIHRDVSPSNVMIDDQGLVKLMDFGVAKLMSDDTDFESRVGILKGKLAYMAPEVLQGQPPSPAGDVYSVGVMYRQMWLGRNELVGTTEAETLANAAHPEFTPLVELVPGVPPGLAEVADRAVAVDPEARYRDAQAMLEALTPVAPMPLSAAQSGLRELVRSVLADPEFPKVTRAPHPEVLDRAVRDAPDLPQPAVGDGPSAMLPTPGRGVVSALDLRWEGTAPDPSFAIERTAPPPPGSWTGLELDEGRESTFGGPVFDPEQGVMDGTSSAEPTSDGGASGPALDEGGEAPLELAYEPKRPPMRRRSLPWRRLARWTFRLALLGLAVAGGYQGRRAYLRWTAEPPPAGALVFDGPTWRGRPGAPADRMREALLAQWEPLEACTRRHARDLQGHAGLNLRIDLDGAGRPTEIRVPPIDGSRLADCVRTAVLNVQFPAPERAGRYVQPLRIQGR